MKRRKMKKMMIREEEEDMDRYLAMYSSVDEEVRDGGLTWQHN